VWWVRPFTRTVGRRFGLTKHTGRRERATSRHANCRPVTATFRNFRKARGRGGFAVPSTATFRVRRDSGQGDHQTATKPAPKPIQVLPGRPNGPAHLNGNLAQIEVSDEPVIRQAISLVQGKWRIAILCHLQDGPLRVGELKRRLRPISKKVLNQHLRRMERDGLIVRTELSSKIPHVEYALTNHLRFSVLLLLQTIAQCGVQKSSPWTLG
jgi:DNA-binding HxlR family transcriptional regulator